jgi:hypothetical protein
VSRTVYVFVWVVVVLSAASVWGQVAVFSDGSGYVFFRGGGVAVYSIDGRLMYAGGGPAYLGPTCLALGAGSGVSLVTFRNELRVFYPLNFTPTLVGTDCVAVVAVNQSLGVYISPERRFSFSLAAPPFALAFFRGVGYVLDAGGDVWAVGRNVSKIAVGGYPVGAVSGPDCVVVSVVRGAAQYFYRVDRGAAELLASWPARVGLSVPFHVGPGCRLAVADGLKRTAVAVDGNYTIYGTSTGLVEVYEGDRLVYVKSVGAPVLSASSAGLNIAYETPAGASSLVISPVRVVTNCGSWTAFVERGAVYRLPQVIPLGEGARCVHVSNKTEGGVIYATYQRQFYVKLISPSPFEGWMAEGSEVPPPPPAAAGYVRLVPVGWEVEGRRYASLRVERPLVARAVYRAAPAVSGPLGNGTAVEVKVAAEEVVWPQQPAAEVRRLYYVAVREPGYVEGGSGYYPAGSVVRIGVKMPEAPPGCRHVFAGWVGLNATGSEAEVVVARPISASPRLVMQCRVSLATRYGSVADAPEWVNVGDVIEPRVEPEAVWSPFPLLYEFSGWRIDGSIVRRITVTGPVAGEAVWTLNPLPAAALAGSAAAAVAFLLWRRRSKRGRLQSGGLRGG